MITSICCSHVLNLKGLKRFAKLSSSTSSRYEQNLNELGQEGFSVLKSVFSLSEISQMNTDYQILRKKALSIVANNSNERERVWMENNEETRSKYWCQKNSSEEHHDIILQAGVGRYDLWKGFHINVESKVLDDIINRLLSSHTHYSGIVLSTPGSSDQYWHRDVDNLSNFGDTSGSTLMNVDDFYYTLLIPCAVDVTAINGPTEFMVSSHRSTASEFDSLQKVQATLSVGDVLIFNGKMNHRGLGNKNEEGGEERPLVYKVYHRPWYSDNYRAGVAES